MQSVDEYHCNTKKILELGNLAEKLEEQNHLLEKENKELIQQHLEDIEINERLVTYNQELKRKLSGMYQ